GASPRAPIARQLLLRARRAAVAGVNHVQPPRAVLAARAPRQETNMRTKRTISTLAAVTAVAVAAVGPASAGARVEGNAVPASAKKDIVETAVAAGKFDTLAALLKKAGLVKTLKGKGPYTVFAPTDKAFSKVPKA